MSFKHNRTPNDGIQSAATTSHAPYALYGTPLPAYDSNSRDDGSYVPVWKQEVTDERGRKRLHGAFTGGWSAGYFNTVGSKDGWTPAAFVTSRSKRAKIQGNDGVKAQTIDDFMDDEDRAEMAASQRLETHDAFAGLGDSKTSKADHGMFADIFRATEDTIGSRLLQKMGWKPGHGIGAKVQRQATGDKHGALHLFAPENVRVVKFARKQDRKGLGYEGESKLGQPGVSSLVDDEIDERDSNILQRSRQIHKKATIPRRKSAFGVGVLNDTGSDDEDPYALGPQIEHSRVIAERRKKKSGLPAADSLTRTPKVVNPKHKSMLRMASDNPPRKKCHDGREALPGFVLAESAPHDFLQNPFPPPIVPTGWKPRQTSAQNQNPKTEFQSTADAARDSQLDHRSRAELLGEQQLPGKSIFDYMSASARDRLVSATGNQNLPKALGEGPPPGFEASDAAKQKTLWDLVPTLSKATALSALERGQSGWMPYGEDESKRGRYRHFIELSAGLHSKLPERNPNHSIDEWKAELSEFAQAAEVFKPVSGLIASRFVTSSSKPKLASDALEQTVPALESQEPADKAAKMNLFGPLTRSTQAFLPSRLLCKRFGVKQPDVQPEDNLAPEDSGNVVRMKQLDIVSQASLDRIMAETRDPPQSHSNDTNVSRNGTEDLQQKTNEHAKVDWERNEALEVDRAGDAVFKAIFGSDDESS